MSPERIATFVARWVRLYTAGLPAPVARRRRAEISADLADHIAHDRSIGVQETRIARNIASRMLRGALADLSWRGHELRTARTRSNKEETVASALARPALRVSIFVVAVLAIPLVGSALSEEVAWSASDFVLAGALLAVIGTCFEAAVQRRGNVLVGGAVAVLGLAAAGTGEIDDAPGLVVLGALLIAGGGAVVHRRTNGLR